MAPKRPGDSPNSTTSKVPKIEPVTNDEFSSSVKKKLSSSTRTGQACDRCKVRKIRCDARAGGCTACAANHTECKTTDRITGRATSRGYTEAIEQENQLLRHSVAQLQQQLRDVGADVKPLAIFSGLPQGSDHSQNLDWSASSETQLWEGGAATTDSATQFQGSISDSSGEKTHNVMSLQNNVMSQEGCTGDNHLGVSSTDNALSPMKGTSLSLFGFQIDLADFIPPEVNESSSFDSYQSFVAFAFRKDPKPDKVDLPASYDECETYANWFFRSINPFTPILHKPDFMRLLSSFYNDPQYRPAPSDFVLVHMVLAIIKFQFSLRNGDASMLEQSMSHYKYALSFLHDLIESHKIADIQALGLICVHLRSFQKPGAAWVVTSTALNFAVELGLHRSVTTRKSEAIKGTSHEFEMRKRIFWTILSIHVGLCGKLGRPVPIRMEDIDVELPKPYHDTLPSENPTPNDFRRCSFRVGILVHKLSAVFLQLYSTIYTVRGLVPSAYERKVRELDREIASWRENIPVELREKSQTAEEDRISALYTQLWDLEFQLALHHPAVCRSNNVAFVETNLNKCLETTTNILRIVAELREYRSLDYTWLNCTTYLAAIFTTLYIHSQRKDQITSSDVTKLQAEMDLWVKIMGDMGDTLRSGNKLQNRVKAIIDQAMGVISRNMAKRTASAASAVVQDVASQQSGYGAETVPAGYDSDAHLNEAAASTTNAIPGRPVKYLNSDVAAPTQPVSSYSTTSQYTYPDPSNSSIQTYPTNSTSLNTASYSASDPTLSQQSIASSSRHHSTSSYMYNDATTAAATAAVAASYPSSKLTVPGPLSWRQWAQNTVANSGPQEFLNSANALMALGGRDGTNAPNGTAGVAGTTAVTTAGTHTNSHSNATGPSLPSTSHPPRVSRMGSISAGGTPQMSDLQAISLSAEQAMSASGQVHAQASIQAQLHAQAQSRAHTHSHSHSHPHPHSHVHTDAHAPDQLWPLMVFDIRQDGSA